MSTTQWGLMDSKQGGSEGTGWSGGQAPPTRNKYGPSNEYTLKKKDGSDGGEEPPSRNNYSLSKKEFEDKRKGTADPNGP